MAGWATRRRLRRRATIAVPVLVVVAALAYLVFEGNDGQVRASDEKRGAQVAGEDGTDGGGATPRGRRFDTTEDLNLGTVGVLEADYTGGGRRVAVLGDSLVHSARIALREQLSDTSLVIGALQGEGIAEGPVSAGFPDASLARTARRYAAGDPDVFVLAVGTADTRHASYDLDRAIEVLGAIRQALDDACVVTVTVTEDSGEPGFDGSRARRLNDELRRIGTVVVDWNGTGARLPANRFLDGVHLSEIGKQRYAEAVAAGVRECP